MMLPTHISSLAFICGNEEPQTPKGIFIMMRLGLVIQTVVMMR
jgi:hypothetical protein